jgi:hypothetical protein
MKRYLTAALVAGGILFSAGAAPAFADSGYGHGVHRDGGFSERGFSELEEVRHRGGHWRHRHWRHHRHMSRHCFWDRVCWRNRWGERRCELQRVCRPRW